MRAADGGVTTVNDVVSPRRSETLKKASNSNRIIRESGMLLDVIIIMEFPL